MAFLVKIFNELEKEAIYPNSFLEASIILGTKTGEGPPPKITTKK